MIGSKYIVTFARLNGGVAYIKQLHRAGYPIYFDLAEKQLTLCPNCKDAALCIVTMYIMLSARVNKCIL